MKKYIQHLFRMTSSAFLKTLKSVYQYFQRLFSIVGKNQLFTSKQNKKLLLLILLLLIAVFLFFIYHLFFAIPSESDQIAFYNPEDPVLRLGLESNINQELNQDFIEITLVDLFLYNEFLLDNEYYCLEEVQIRNFYGVFGNNSTSITVPDNETNTIYFNDVCSDSFHTLEFTPTNPITLKVLFSEDTILKYPFDKRFFIIYIVTKIRTNDGELKMIIPEISLEMPYIQENIPTAINAYDVINRKSLSTGTDPELRTEKAVEIYQYLTRPFWRKLLTAVIPVLLSVFVILMCNLTEIGSASEVAIGILFGIWSIKSFLIPSGFPGSILIDRIISGVYILFAIGAVYRFIFKPIIDRNTIIDPS